MTADGDLERRYRRLLAWYPAEHRKAYGEEMIGVLLAAAPEGSSRPGLAATVDLVRGGLRARFRPFLRRLVDIDWPDALAVCSVAVPVILLSYYLVHWLLMLLVYVAPMHTELLRGLVVLALAAPPMLALRWRRSATLVALLLAGSLSVDVLSGAAGSGAWISYGEPVCAALALLLGAVALGLSPGPRRGAELLALRGWMVLIGAGIAMGLTSLYLSALPILPALIIVPAVLTAIAAFLALVLPGCVARGLLVLLAMPAYPGAISVIAFGGPFGVHLPNSALLPTGLFACAAAVALWRARRQMRRRQPPASPLG